MDYEAEIEDYLNTGGAALTYDSVGTTHTGQVTAAAVVDDQFNEGQKILRIDLDINGLTVFIARVSPEDDIPASPTEPHLGLDHFGLRVDDLDEAVAELKQRGAEFSMEPRTIRPGVKIAFVLAPDRVRIELLERS